MRVLIAAAGDLLQAGLQTCLKPVPDMDVHISPDIATLLYDVERQAPDVILLDDQFEPAVWLGAVVIRLRKLAPQVAVAILGTFADGALIHELFEAGIRGYLVQSDSLVPYLEHALRTMQAGNPYLSPSASSAYLIAQQAGQRQRLHRDPEALRVLRLLASGKNTPEIASLLGIKIRRVYWIQEKLRRRFNVSTTAAVICQASRQGYLRSNS